MEQVRIVLSDPNRSLLETGAQYEALRSPWRNPDGLNWEESLELKGLLDNVEERGEFFKKFRRLHSHSEGCDTLLQTAWTTDDAEC